MTFAMSHWLECIHTYTLVHSAGTARGMNWISEVIVFFFHSTGCFVLLNEIYNPMCSICVKMLKNRSFNDSECIICNAKSMISHLTLTMASYNSTVAAAISAGLAAVTKIFKSAPEPATAVATAAAATGPLAHNLHLRLHSSQWSVQVDTRCRTKRIWKKSRPHAEWKDSGRWKRCNAYVTLKRGAF